MKNFSINFKILVLVLILSIFGIFGSAFMIDNYCKTEKEIAVQNSIDVVVNVYNNSEKVNVKVDEKVNGEVNVTIDDKKIETSEQVNNETSQYPSQGIVSTEYGLNIRRDANIDSEKVGVYEYGEKIEIVDEVGDWYITDEGFVYKEFVMLI